MRTIVYAFLILFCLGGISPAETSSIPEFRNDVMPVLSKAGCNLGTCHGNLNGKGGLKLSLRGQDPDFDHQSLVMAARGRRVDIAAPKQSLFLQKATGAVSHGGGPRFSSQSNAHRVLVDWIRAGAVGPSSLAPTLVKLEVTPQSAIVAAPTDQVAIQVQATFSDGSTRDVTQTACYELSNLNATVDDEGVVRRSKLGETTLIVRFLQLQRPVPIAFIQPSPEFEWNAPTPRNAIDEHVFAKLKRLRANPSQVCDDSVFVRRAFLDAIGRLPTSDEARSFVSEKSPEKRAKLIDRLLSRPEFADFWALKWADVLRTEEKVLDTEGVKVFHGWIRDCIAEGRPLDQFVRELVTGTGSTFNNPPANFYRANRNPSTRGETTARLFLGIRMECAKCHNHPFDRWTQEDYYQWSNLFSQIDYEIGENKRQDNLDKNEFVGDQQVLIAKKDEVKNPSTGAAVLPKFLGDAVLSESQRNERLSAAAEWLTSKDNDLFAASQANFIWYQLMGLGVVDPIDDFRLTNPPSNPALMKCLSDAFRESDFDVRSLVRFIMNSSIYQLSSLPNETNRNETTSFSHALTRRLPAEVLLDMQSDVLESPASFLGYANTIRAVQIPGATSKLARRKGQKDGDRFLKTFGKPNRILACDCERSNETTLQQVFVLIGEGLNGRLDSFDNRIARLATSSLSDSEVIEELYWATLSRGPSDVELAAALKLIEEPAERNADGFGGLFRAMVANPSQNHRVEALRDLAWALLNAKEFLFRR